MRASPKPLSRHPVVVDVDELKQLIAGSKARSISVYAGILTGALMILCGCFFMYVGIRGDITWIFEGAGLSSSLWNLSPGGFLVVVGSFVLILMGRRRETVTISVTQEVTDAHAVLRELNVRVDQGMLANR